MFLKVKRHIVPHYDSGATDFYVEATDGKWRGQIHVNSLEELDEAEKEIRRQYMQRFDKPDASLQRNPLK